ncbi:FHA domain-containing protein [Mucilaginibacter sp. RS28]|uniref:FHA domain-containing protein n=1 Tax=Mucilaginibacter straminoryzae TaxID=2932774 RepID=A0A9X1XA73_9SPHI|nr:FHA domain-containing protein [Mucilaginibacter straminoryzae]MCJ8211039.1 FHA domain-containing protein [Mucilaginibacter straminoryzae]
MFGLFKSSTGERPMDVKAIRDALLRFIKDQLQKLEGEAGAIKGLQLYLNPLPEDRHLYEAALNIDHAEQFKNEVQRIADDYALALPQSWTLEVVFTEEIPTQAVKAANLGAALFIRTTNHNIRKSSVAFIRVLNGKAERDEYEITSEGDKVNIGRERQVQVKDGFFRKNDIAFPGDSENESNKYISRQHAHIEWNNDTGSFMIFADEGGVPPGNKVKIHTTRDENLIKLNSTHIGHQLQEGDQVILGQSAVIEFSYKPSVS